MPGNTIRERAEFLAKILSASEPGSRHSRADGQRSGHGRSGANQRSREYSRLRGSARISTCGSATRKTCARGNCCAKRAKPINGPWPRRGDAASGAFGEWDSQRKRAYESILAAEGSDWNWWYGPEHGSANDAEFDALYRKHLTEVYRALGEPVPEALARPIKRAPERARREAPMAYLEVKVDGRESNYFILRVRLI